jgi:Xaa-Pro dipeptidase
MVPLPFSPDEYHRRLHAVRGEMERRSLDLLIVNDVASQHYLTGYDGWSFYTPQMVIITLDHEPIWLGRAMDAAGGKLTAWMQSDNVVGFPETYVQQTERHPMDWIAGWIEQRGWGTKRIGVELDAYFYSAMAHARLTAGLPNATFVGADRYSSTST